MRLFIVLFILLCALNANASPVISQILYVNQLGNDLACDGSRDNPCATVAQAQSLIPDNSSTKVYKIEVGPGNITETVAFKLKPWIYIAGVDMGATRWLPKGDITADPSLGGPSGGRFGIIDLTISGSTPNINLNLQALGGTASTVFFLQNVRLNGLFTYKARTSADFYEVHGGVYFGNWAISGGQGLVMNTYIPGSVSINTLGYVGAGSADFHACSSAGSLSLSTGGSTFTLNKTASKFDLGVSLAGSALTVKEDTAKELKYSPADATAWVAPIPANVSDALDRMAALLKTLNGGSAIP